MPPSSPHDFLTVAELLLEEAGDDPDAPDAEWAGCEDARARSAVSRGYYAVFRALKARLLPRRVEWRRDAQSFPSIAVHDSVRRSMEKALTEKHRLVRAMKALVRRRNTSDYEFVPAMTGALAEADVVAASDAMQEVAALSDAALDSIALELSQIDALVRRRRLFGS